jgi:hypothetical protein
MEEIALLSSEYTFEDSDGKVAQLSTTFPLLVHSGSEWRGK